MYFKNYSLRTLFSKSLVLTFLAIFPAFFVATAQASPEFTAIEVSEQTSKMLASPKITTSTINKYITTTGNIRNDQFSNSLDQNIIFSMILVILLGFLTLFSAVGYHRSAAMQKVFKLLQLQR